MIRLAVFDIDRTLIPPETGKLAEETRMALQELRERGIATSIASGRQMQQLPSDLRGIEFDFFILSNGTYVTNSDGTVLHQESIDTDTVRQLAEDMQCRELPMEIRYIRGFCRVDPARRIEDFIAQYWNQPFQTEVPDRETIIPQPGEAPISCAAIIPPEEHAWFEQKYLQLDFLPVFGMPLCDVNKSGVSKATGLEIICAHMGISLAETIAFGDDRNDLEMIEAAGIGVAMGEANEDVRAAADYLTDFSRNLGVVKGLRHFQLIK